MLDCNKADSYVNPPEFYENMPDEDDEPIPSLSEQLDRTEAAFHWKPTKHLWALSAPYHKPEHWYPARDERQARRAAAERLQWWPAAHEAQEPARDDDCFMEERLFPSVLVEED